MKFSVKEIAALLNSPFTGEGSRLISGVAGLGEAGDSDLSFIKNAGDKKVLNLFKASKAGCVLVPKGIAGNGKTLIEVLNPMDAFAKILEVISKEKNPFSPGIHPTAVVAASAQLGKNVFIGPYAVLEDHVSIGDNVRLSAYVFIGARSKIGKNSHLYPHVTVREECVVGNDCIIHPNAVIGADGFGFYFGGGKHNKIHQVGNVVIEDDVEIGAGTTIDRATTGSTRVGRGTKIDNLVQIAHNVDIGELSLIVAQVGIGGSTKIGKGVVIAGQAGVADHMLVGDGAKVGGGAGVRGHLEPNAVVWGTPAIPLQEKLREVILLKNLPKILAKLRKGQ